MTSPLLAIENLSVGFRQQQHVRPVVNAISLQVNAGGKRWRWVGESRVRKKRDGAFPFCVFCLPLPLSTSPAIFAFTAQSLLHASEQTLRGVRGNKIAMIFQEPMVFT